MKNIFTILLILFYTISFSQLIKTVKSQDEIGKGWVCIGMETRSNETIYTIVDGKLYPKGTVMGTCLQNKIDKTDWKIGEYRANCIDCSIGGRNGGLARYGCHTITKITEKISGNDISRNSYNNNRRTSNSQSFFPPPPPISPENKFGALRIYTLYPNELNIFIYLVSSKAEKIKKYKTGFNKTIANQFNVEESDLVYSNLINKYFYSNNTISKDSDGVYSIILTEGTYKIIAYDNNFMYKYEKTIDVIDNQDRFYEITPRETFVQKTPGEKLIINGYNSIDLLMESNYLIKTSNLKPFKISIIFLSMHKANSKNIVIEYVNLNNQIIKQNAVIGETFLMSNQIRISCKELDLSYCPIFYYKIE